MLPRTAVRIATSLLVAACVLSALSGCGRPADVAPLSEPWPLTLPDPAVLGYGAVRLQPDELRRELIADIGFCPDGLTAGAPVIAVRLDSQSFGGPIGVILPIADERAFTDSLQHTPALQPLGKDAYRLTLSADSRLGMLLRMFSALQSGGPMAMLRSFGDASSTEFTLRVEVEDGRALVVPSYEALSVCRRFADATRSFHDAPPHDLVVSLDLARLSVVYAQQLRDAEDRLRGLISGTQSLSMFGALAAARRGAGGGGLPVNWEMIWAFKSMLDLGAIDAVQLQVTIDHDRAHAVGLWPEPGATASRVAPESRERSAAHPSDAEDAGDEEAEVAAASAFVRSRPLGPLLDAIPRAVLRVQLAERSALAPVAATLAPVPVIQGARLAVAADADAFPRAFAEWCRPLGEVVKGKGPPCDRYLDELAVLVRSWGGVSALFERPDGSLAALASLEDGADPDLDAWRRWLEPLLASAHLANSAGGVVNGLALEARPDGRQVLREPSGDVIATLGRRGTSGWCLFEDAAAAPEDLCDRLRRASEDAAGAQGPALRLDWPGASLDVTVSGRELALQWAADPGG